jgi:Flp pilus assembly protein TadB
MVFVILALVWVAVLVPQTLRNRAEDRPTDSIRAFRRQLAVLGRTAPGDGGPTLALVPSSGAARARGQARRRRRAVLRALLVAMAATLVLGLVPALRPLLVVHVVLDGLCVAYVALLVRRRRAAEQARRVVELPVPASTSTDPEPLLTSAGG